MAACCARYKRRRSRIAGHAHLDLRERRIATLLEAKVPVSAIATELGRHRSTIAATTRGPNTQVDSKSKRDFRALEHAVMA